MAHKLLALITLVLLTSSCSIYHINSTDTTEGIYPQKSPDEIVYMEEVSQPHEVIGTVTVNGERRQRNMNDVIVKMKREAAIMGGDVITEIQSDATGVWKQLPVQQTIGNAYVRANFTAKVVVLK